ncbi:MAG: Holliday junction resolvase [Candidatus Aenigmarchaeota archaeon]|nr:Holliday junction resolvase [Candidatus Aenigmarchaeota archaeon]
MPVNAKGSRRERELLEKLVKEGLMVHRIAGSGKGEDAICDLIAVDTAGKVQLIEVKSRKKYFYTKDHTEQLTTLIEAAKRFNATPILAVKINYQDWKFVDLKNGIPAKV